MLLWICGRTFTCRAVTPQPHSGHHDFIDPVESKMKTISIIKVQKIALTKTAVAAYCGCNRL